MNHPKLVLGISLWISLVATTLVSAASSFLIQQSPSATALSSDFGKDKMAAPIAISGNNVYIAWWTNTTGNNEVMFRASTDGGKTFGNKINLSTSKDSSSKVELAASGNNVYVTWCETNGTLNAAVLKVSNDNGKTFGPTLKLDSNDTISVDIGVQGSNATE
ncbi:MAG TPA: hypothetical protein VE089_02060 [Nitrososphaeraceae archaeon]|nr:hypothetical protein [Nitrososphaeraceae archaeon]